MPDDTIVNLEELAQNLPDHPERYTELADVDIFSLSFDDLETYSALLEQYATQMDPNIVDSLKARIEERVKDLEAVEPVDESAEGVVEDEPAEESAENFIEDEPAEETAQAVAREAFNPQELLAEWNQAKEAGDEGKMEEIGQKLADVLPHISEEDIQKSSLDDVYALHDLLSDETFIDHIPMKDRQSARELDENLYSQSIQDFEKEYGLNWVSVKYPNEIKEGHEKLDKISTENLVQGLDDETKDLLNRLTVVRPLTKAISTRIKKRVKQDQPDNDIALMLERIRFEAQMRAANKDDHFRQEPMLTQKLQKEFQDLLQYHIAILVGAEEIRAIVNNERRDPTKDDLKAIYQKLLETKAPISVDQRTLAIWHAQRQQTTETVLKRMDKQQGYKEIVQTLRGRLAEIDEKCHKKYGNWYNLAKTALKSAGWGAAYSVGAAFGPIGITAVATASFANNAYKQYKEYKKAKENNPELKSFWGYLKNNKMALASLELGLFSTVTAAAGFSGDAAVKAAKMAAGTFLGLAGALKASTKAFKETEGSRFDKTKAALKSFGASTAGFVVGLWAGQAAGSAIGSHIDTDTQIPTENNLDGVSQPINETPVNEAPINEAPVNDAPVDETPVNEVSINEAPVNDAPVDEAPVNDAPVAEAPVIDLDNLTDQQEHDLDMLFKRAPTEAYEELQKVGYEGDWMNSRELAEAYDNLTDAQKTALVQYAGERFDDNGHFQDVEGHTSATEMEERARAYSAARAEVRAEQFQAQHENPVETEQNAASVQPETVVTEQDRASVQPEVVVTKQDSVESAEIVAETNVDVHQVQHIQPEMTTPEKLGMEQIDKVKIHGDDIKVVGHDAEGHRVVEHLENREGIDNSKIKVNDDQTKVVRNNGYFKRDVYKLDQEGNGTVTRLNYENGRHHDQMDPSTAKEMERIRSMLHPQESKTTETSTHTSSANPVNTRFTGRNDR